MLAKYNEYVTKKRVVFIAASTSRIGLNLFQVLFLIWRRCRVASFVVGGKTFTIFTI